MKRLAAAVALLAGVHGAVSLGRAMVQPEEAIYGPRTADAPGPMTSAAGGPIVELALQLHRPGPEAVTRVLREIVAALDPSTRVHLVVGDHGDEPLAASLRGEGRPAVRTIRADREITSWIHDRLLVLDPPAGGGAPTLLAPPEPHPGSAARVGDWRVPWDLSRAALGPRSQGTPGPRVVTARFQFEGGDLIADEQRVYVTTRLLGHERSPGRSRAVLLEEIERAVGRPVLLLGDDDHPVPQHHVGMFVTPLGRGRVLVADPDLAVDVLARAGVDVASAGQHEVGGAPLPLDLSPARLESFRNVARALRAAGLEVIPLPALPSPEPTVLVSYGNAMLEHRADGRLHVLMPTYGIPALDAAATAVYRAQGAIVHPIRVDDVFRMGGSIGCLVAPLLRGEPAYISARRPKLGRIGMPVVKALPR